MASLIESYEHQYFGITSEITSQIGRIPNLATESKQNAISNVDRLMEEAKELLEQMHLEVRGLSSDIRPKYTNRLKSYEKELERLERDYRKSKSAFSDKVLREELLNGEECTQFENQRSRLLDNTEMVERMGHSVDNTFQICVDTEEIGGQILSDLHSQREQINRSRTRLKETDAMLGKSSRVLSGMMKRIVQNRIVLICIVLIILITIIVGVYLAVHKTKKD
ncbi:vesicle transport through interaction with t-SNAREs homolog 1A-like [Watersipora subatra]|uniref:vesicle transport through interaction with t-SNAREs homolog 1A-like n=1 Tax=Watersipora subatra TaxID=2589382 RepID=UPI00355AD2F6